jgi:primosomal protein N' (replication factor Y)
MQAFLKVWVGCLRAMKSRVRWSLEVDPLDI